MNYIYCIFDTKACKFGPLVSLANDAVAKRFFKQSLLEVFDEFKCDYVLYCLGTFDNCHIDIPIVVNESNRVVMNGSELIDSNSVAKFMEGK